MHKAFQFPRSACIGKVKKIPASLRFEIIETAV